MEIPDLTPRTINDSTTLSRLTEFLRSLNLQAGDNVEISSQGSGGTRISVPLQNTNVLEEVDNTFASVSYSGDAQYAITLSEIEVRSLRSQDLPDEMRTLDGVTWNFEVTPSTATIVIYAELDTNDSPVFKWGAGSGTVTGLDATTIAAESDVSFIPDGRLDLATIYMNSTGYSQFNEGNTHPTIDLERHHENETPYFYYSGGALYLRNAYVLTEANSVPYAPNYVAVGDGTHNIYVGWDTTLLAWYLATLAGSLKSTFLIGHVAIESGSITYQRMRTGQLLMPTIGLTNGRSFTDANGKDHVVSISAGVITSWTVT